MSPEEIARLEGDLQLQKTYAQELGDSQKGGRVLLSPEAEAFVPLVFVSTVARGVRGLNELPCLPAPTELTELIASLDEEIEGMQAKVASDLLRGGGVVASCLPFLNLVL